MGKEEMMVMERHPSPWSRSPVRVGGQWTPRVPKGPSLLSLLSLLALPSPKVFSLETAQSAPMPSAPAPRAGNAGTGSVRSATLLSTPHRPYSSLRPQAHTHHHPTYLMPKVCSRLPLVHPDCWGQWASLPGTAHSALTPSSVPGVPGPLTLSSVPGFRAHLSSFCLPQNPRLSARGTLGVRWASCCDSLCLFLPEIPEARTVWPAHTRQFPASTLYTHWPCEFSP